MRRICWTSSEQNVLKRRVRAVSNRASVSRTLASAIELSNLHHCSKVPVDRNAEDFERTLPHTHWRAAPWVKRASIRVCRAYAGNHCRADSSTGGVEGS